MRNRFSDLREKLSDPISTAFNKNKMEKRGKSTMFRVFTFVLTVKKFEIH